jgi:hypothetical protein
VPSSFETLKGKLGKSHETKKEELFRNVAEILDLMPEEELIQVFLSYMTMVEQIITTSGEYIQISKFHIEFCDRAPLPSW